MTKLPPGYRITKVRTRGRPKKLPTLKYGALVGALDEMMEQYRQKGLTEPQARRSAFKELREAMETEDPDGHPLEEGRWRRINAQTFERYYRQGIKELRNREIWLAQEIDKIIAERGKQAVPQYDPCSMGGVTWRRYKRGKRALSAALRNKRNQQKQEK